MSAIKRTVHTTVYLGQNGIGKRLVIMPGGAVLPSAYGANAVVSNISGGVIINDGQVVAGYGGPVGISGGIGVDLTAHGTLTNAGLVAGGGAYSANGGAGVNIAAAVGATISNTGTIAGGDNLTAGFGGTGQGGDAIHDLTNGANAAVTITNSGTCVGGAGGRYGGDGINFGQLGAANTILNSGLILGGAGFYGKGSGVVIGGNGTLSNQGTVGGGYGGGAGVVLDGNAALSNQAIIMGGLGSYGGTGGTGVTTSQGTVSNQGTISGGSCFISSYYGGVGGAGAYIGHGGTLTNSGVVEGGAAGGAGGVDSRAPRGGDGVDAAGGLLTNTGSIQAGYGGSGVLAGEGGTGVSLGGATLVNSGSIRGGEGGASPTKAEFYGGVGGNGGVGVNIGDSTLTNAGTISGGAGGYGIVESGPAGDAVQCSDGGTLVVDPGAVFNGLVVASQYENDLMVLASGATAGTLSGLGTQFTGFEVVEEVAQATWSLLGSSTLGNASILEVGGTLTFISTAEGTGHVRIDRGATVTAGGALSVSEVVFGPGGGAHLVLDAPGSATSTLAGFGTADTIDLVKLAVNSDSFANGTLTLQSYQLFADGGTGGGPGNGACAFGGGGGAGGAIRLVAGRLVDNGSALLYARGGGGGHNSQSGSEGRIRFESLDASAQTAFRPTPVALRVTGPSPLANPLSPTVRITAINGQLTPAVPQGGYGAIDVVLPSPGVAGVDIATSGVPSGTSVLVTVKPRIGGPAMSATLPLSVCNTAGDCTARTAFNLAAGAYFVEARATFQVP